MKKLKTILLSFLAIACLAAVPVYAVENDACELYDSSVENYELICGREGRDEMSDLMATVSNVLGVVYMILGILAVTFIVVGGVKYMTAQGDPGKITGAKNTITFSIVGLIIALIAFAITSFVLSAIAGTAVIPGVTHSTGVQGVKASKHSLTFVATGESQEVKCTAFPDYVDGREITWELSDSSIVDMVHSENVATITPRSAGSTTLTCKTANGKETKINIAVNPEIAVEEIKVSQTEVSVRVGSTYRISYSLIPSRVTNKNITWSSSDSSIASVDNSGTVKGLKIGRTIITLTAASGVKKEVTVNVISKNADPNNNGSNLALDPNEAPKSPISAPEVEAIFSKLKDSDYDDQADYDRIKAYAKKHYGVTDDGFIGMVAWARIEYYEGINKKYLSFLCNSVGLNRAKNGHNWLQDMINGGNGGWGSVYKNSRMYGTLCPNGTACGSQGPYISNLKMVDIALHYNYPGITNCSGWRDYSKSVIYQDRNGAGEAIYIF